MIRLSAFADEAGDSLKEQIEALHRNEIFMTELRSVDKRNVKTFTETEAKTMQSIFRQEGISLSAIGSPLGKTDIANDYHETEELLKHLCSLASIYETDKIRMFSFFKAHGERERVIEYLNRMVELASSFGVTLCHENEKGIYGDNAERVEDLMRSVPNLQFVYDPANFLQVGERAEQTLERFSSRCTYFHIKDVLMETGELVPAGCGDGDIPRLLELNAYRDTVLTLEPHLKIFGAYTEIDGEEMKHRFHFSDNAEAFDAAANALKGLLLESGYRGRSGCYTKEIF